MSQIRRDKEDELARLKKKTIAELWLDDLDEFERALEKYEKKEREEEAKIIKKSNKRNIVQHTRSPNSKRLRK